MHEQDRFSKLNQLDALGFSSYDMPDGYEITSIDVVRESYNSSYGKHDGPLYSVAGRVSLRRGMGKLSFVTLTSIDGKIQLAFDQSRLSDNDIKKLKLLDLGDIIVSQGNLGTTQTGEITIWVNKFDIISKTLNPPPDKVKGLHDPELKYRNRPVDLWTNSEVMDVMRYRSHIIRSIRDYLWLNGFLEVETPMMQSVAGGALAKPFVTHHNALDIDLYMRIAPELYLKRLLIGGMEKIFEIGKNFRNEGISPKHNPEFTSLEAYQAYGNYEVMMDLVEKLICNVANEVFGTLSFQYGDHTIDLSNFWKRVRMTDLADDYEIYEKEIEPTIIQPTFITHFPKGIVPLAKESKEYPGYAEVFELVIGGIEISPGYTELNDPKIQLENFKSQNKDGHCMDMDFIESLKDGMPPSAGLGLGIDRLVMILTNQSSIKDVILFPLLKPLIKL